MTSARTGFDPFADQFAPIKRRVEAYLWASKNKIADGLHLWDLASAAQRGDTTAIDQLQAILRNVPDPGPANPYWNLDRRHGAWEAGRAAGPTTENPYWSIDGGRHDAFEEGRRVASQFPLVSAR